MTTPKNPAARLFAYLTADVVVVLPRLLAWWAFAMIFFGSMNGLFYWLRRMS